MTRQPRTPLKSVLSLVALLALAWTLAGCNTVSGMGRDIQKAGEKIEDAASGSKKK